MPRSCYLEPNGFTIIGNVKKKEDAISDFIGLATGKYPDTSVRSSDNRLNFVSCSDVYWGCYRNSKVGEMYFGFYFVPSFIHELIKEMNEVFTKWNIEIIHEIKWKVETKRFGSNFAVPIEEDENPNEVCYSILIQVVPTENVKKGKWFWYWFSAIQLYMHHIFRVASLTHPNYIDNNFRKFHINILRNRESIPEKYPYLTYILKQSRHTRNSGLNLHNDGGLTVEQVMNLNNIHHLARCFKAEVEWYGDGKVRKSYQTKLIDEFIKERFKKGDKVYILGRNSSNVNARVVAKVGLSYYHIEFYKKIYSYGMYRYYKRGSNYKASSLRKRDEKDVKISS